MIQKIGFGYIDDNEVVRQNKLKDQIVKAGFKIKDWYSMSEVAKIIGDKKYGPRKLSKFLKEKEVLDYFNYPEDKYVKMGLMKSIVVYKPASYQNYAKLVVSLKGIAFIKKLIAEE